MTDITAPSRSARTPAKRRVRPRHRARGFFLVEVVIAGALISLAFGMAIALIFRMFTTVRELNESERDTLAAARAVTMLRHDVERAATVSVRDGALALGGDLSGDISGVRWATDADQAVVRTAGERVDRFGPLPAAATFDLADGIVRLRVGEADWAFAPLADFNGGRP